MLNSVACVEDGSAVREDRGHDNALQDHLADDMITSLGIRPWTSVDHLIGARIVQKLATRKRAARQVRGAEANRRTGSANAGARICLGRLVGWNDSGPLVELADSSERFNALVC